MTTIRQMIQSSPSKANELLSRLVDTPDTALKTRERLFVDLKEELDLLAQLEEEHLFPALRKHKETKRLVSEALSDNKQIRRLVTELEQTPRESEEFTAKVAELKSAFQQSVRDAKKELLPAVLKALSDEEAQAIVENIEAGKAEIEQAKRAETEQRRAEARHEREQAEKAIAEEKEAADREARYQREQAQKAKAEQKEAADREQKAREATAQEVARASQAVVESANQVTESSQRVATASLSTGSAIWDTMFGMWGVPQGQAVARSPNIQSNEQEEVIPLAEETLIVGKHTIENSRTTVRRYVVETPVEQQVSLYEERVVIERRKPVTDATTGETLTELTVEMIETSEVPVVGKRVAVREEVVLRRERTKRVETVRDTVRRDEIEISRLDTNGRSSRKRTAKASDHA